ncbi:MAG: hypothetical protein JZU65_02040 [Chlorobium sp.]|jgi:hypothetical protein|nr:hypothetical protein [Chlorobium sp.]
MFNANVKFIIEHPGVPRKLFGKLQRAEKAPAELMVQMLIHCHGERLHRLIEAEKACAELDVQLDTESSATLFIGMIYGLIMQSLLAYNAGRIHHDALRVFTIYRRGIRSMQ